MSDTTQKAVRPNPSRGNPKMLPGGKNAGATGGRQVGIRNPHKGNGMGVESHGRGTT